MAKFRIAFDEDFEEEGDEPKKQLYPCPVCERELPADACWVRVVTERETNWSPEEVEYVCCDCWDRLEESKAQDAYDRLQDEKHDNY